MRRLALGAAFFACAPSAEHVEDRRLTPSATSVSKIVGYVGLHQFAEGSHAWATFHRDGVDARSYAGDDPFGREPAATRKSGPCALHPMTALDATPLHLFDAGAITARGGATDVRMWFAEQGYVTEPQPGRARLFFGGERLSVTGRDFSTTVSAPTLPTITEPSALKIPATGPLRVRWKSDAAPTMVIVLSASSPSGDAFIRCATNDGGALDIHEDLLALLPAPPREMRLDVERFDERLAVTNDGLGIVVRVAHTAWIRGVD
jgi:hypothetical protein